MACNQTLGGLVNDCAKSMGGIRRVFIANKDDVASVTVSENKITAITMAESAKFKSYYFRKGTGSYTSTLNVDQANGVNYVGTDVVLQFTRMETTKRIEMVALSVNDLVVIVEDNNGVYWFLGYDNPVNASAGDGQTGTAMTDGNRYTITLHDDAEEWPYEVLVGEEGVDLDTLVG